MGYGGWSGCPMHEFWQPGLGTTGPLAFLYKNLDYLSCSLKTNEAVLA